MEEAWLRYLELIDERPDLFADSNELEIVLDKKAVEEFEHKSGKTIGVVYRSRFNTLVVDLVRNPKGDVFAYERLVQTSLGTGVVSVPIHNGRFVLLKQYRHSMRNYQFAFPRGYGEDGLAAAENVRKELSEELSASMGGVTPLGTVVANSGISGDAVEVFLCEVLSYRTDVGHEEIVDSVELSRDELVQWIADGRINDGFTLSAFELFQSKDAVSPAV